MTQRNRGDRAAVRLLALGGSTRAGSSSEEALRVAASCAEKSGAVVEVLAGRRWSCRSTSPSRPSAVTRPGPSPPPCAAPTGC